MAAPRLAAPAGQVSHAAAGAPATGGCLAALRPCSSRPAQHVPTHLPKLQAAQRPQAPPARSSAAAACAASAAAEAAGGGGGSGSGSGGWRGSSGGGSGAWHGGGAGPDDAASGRGDSRGWRRPLSALLAALLPASLALALPGAAAAARAAPSRGRAQPGSDEAWWGLGGVLPSWEVDAFVERMADLSGPILNNMGFSGLLGACAAAALKWVGRTLAASLGMGLILIQVLAHCNVISVNWSVVHRQAAAVLDRTGDGRLDTDDCKRAVKKGLIVLSEGVPSLSGFLLGFLVGLRVF